MSICTPEIISALLESGRPFEITPEGGVIVDGKRSKASRTDRNSRYYKRLKASESVLNATETSESVLTPPSPLSPSQVSPSPPSSSPPLSPSLHADSSAAPPPPRSNGTAKPQTSKPSVVGKPASTADPRHKQFFDLFAEAYQAANGEPYSANGGKDGEQLRALLARKPDLTAEKWCAAMRWCRSVVEKDQFAPACVKQTSDLGAFCAGWSRIVECRQTYKSPEKRQTPPTSRSCL